MFLLDTDTCIHFMKGNPETVARFAAHGPATIFLSAISYHELLDGALHSGAVQRHLDAVAEFIAPVTVLPFTRFSAELASQVRQALSAGGQSNDPLDRLIAGHALEHQLILVTGITRDFSRVQGLQLENWS